jgi:DNA polymerase III subunit epsilon
MIDGRAYYVREHVYAGAEMKLCDATFVVTDTETTGTSPTDGRIIEIAAVKVCGDEIVDRFTQLINPGRSVPWRITQLTGISTAMVFDKPRAADVMPAYRDFLADGIFAAHNLTFDERFINSEFARCDLRMLPMGGICTLRLARRLLRGLRSKGLASVADFYGIPIVGRHRALGDAEATAQVLIRLLKLAQDEHGVETVDDLRLFQNKAYAQIRKSATHIDRIRDTILKRLPKTPGVYFMRNGRGEIIYIGKALDLNSRVRSYFSAVEAHPSRLRKMVAEVRDIGWKETPSELGALLLESRLIKEHQPKYNRAQLTYRNRPFLRLDVEHTAPSISVKAVALPDGGEYFGPLAGRREAELLSQVIDEFFGLRECDDVTFNRRKPCMLASIGRCPHTPCENGVGEEYLRDVERVKTLLRGEDTSILERMNEAMRAASAELDFERAARYRDLLQKLSGLFERWRTGSAPVFDRNSVVMDRESRCLFFIRGGRLMQEFRLGENGQLDAQITEAVDACLKPNATGDRYWKEEADELRTVGAWFHRNRERLVTIDYTPEACADDLLQRVECLVRGIPDSAVA